MRSAFPFRNNLMRTMRGLALGRSVVRAGMFEALHEVKRKKKKKAAAAKKSSSKKKGGKRKRDSGTGKFT